MWTAPVTILDDEDEGELLSRFVELSAAYPAYTPFDIAQEVFRGKENAELRANQAGLIWGNKLEIKERIRKARLNGGTEPEEISEEEASYRKAMAMFNDENVPWTVRYKFFELAQKIKGFIKDTAEPGKDSSNRRNFPVIAFKEYQD